MRFGPPAGRWFLVLALVVVSLNLRGPIVAVSPVLEDIQRDLEITAGSAGLLTSIPVLCFAAVSPLVAVFARRLGVDLTITISLVVLAVGVAIRPWAGFGLLVAGTIMIGAAIAVGNVLIPVLVRRDFPERPGPLLSASTTSLIISATIPAVLTAPLASVIGWRAALAIWACLVVVALAIWSAATQTNRQHQVSPTTPEHDAPTARTPPKPVWRNRSAWELGLFFGIQSFLFYAATAWLPTMLRDAGGLDATAAGTALSVFQLIGIAGAIAVPVLIRRREVRYTVVVVLSVLWVIFLAGLLVAPQAWPVLCALGGLAQGGCLAMGLSLIALRSTTSDAARRVSAMVQTVAYCFSAPGPVVIGGISMTTNGWTTPFSMLIALSIACGVLGIRAASPRSIM
ncbi:MFS transporter [Phytoactinopolyspora mesophila]|uniref:MFS transporter n=1 Tax=Phytoactinopolyspora mesophila TaxID=2650750 RepID=A0A7K3M4U1_9ACTN|nr:MFS transporter [Phytoactinopolyspora mesophila]NDL58266.1 MFS transporter [Phytoactinopolyspora mesophila]